MSDVEFPKLYSSAANRANTANFFARDRKMLCVNMLRSWRGRSRCGKTRHSNLILQGRLLDLELIKRSRRVLQFSGRRGNLLVLQIGRRPDGVRQILPGLHRLDVIIKLLAAEIGAFN